MAKEEKEQPETQTDAELQAAHETGMQENVKRLDELQEELKNLRVDQTKIEQLVTDPLVQMMIDRDDGRADEMLPGYHLCVILDEGNPAVHSFNTLALLAEGVDDITKENKTVWLFAFAGVQLGITPDTPRFIVTPDDVIAVGKTPTPEDVTAKAFVGLLGKATSAAEGPTEEQLQEKLLEQNSNTDTPEDEEELGDEL